MTPTLPTAMTVVPPPDPDQSPVGSPASQVSVAPRDRDPADYRERIDHSLAPLLGLDPLGRIIE
jgi:hypothetical protein